MVPFTPSGARMIVPQRGSPMVGCDAAKGAPVSSTTSSARTMRRPSVARMVDANPTKMFPREASMAKLKATETSKRMTIDAMQMMGGYGYATEFDAERLMRGAIISTVYGGTNEIQRDIIGKTFGL